MQIKKRMVAKLRALKVELRKRMHDSIAATGQWLNLLLKGHLNYFDVSGNSPSLWWFFNEIRWLWLRSLRRRSQKAFLNREKFIRLTGRFFPPIKPAPAAVTPLRRQDPREELGALAALAGICAGGEEQSSPLPRPSRSLRVYFRPTMTLLIFPSNAKGRLSK